MTGSFGRFDLFSIFICYFSVLDLSYLTIISSLLRDAVRLYGEVSFALPCLQDSKTQRRYRAWWDGMICEYGRVRNMRGMGCFAFLFVLIFLLLLEFCCFLIHAWLCLDCTYSKGLGDFEGSPELRHGEVSWSRNSRRDPVFMRDGIMYFKNNGKQHLPRDTCGSEDMHVIDFGPIHQHAEKTDR